MYSPKIFFRHFLTNLYFSKLLSRIRKVSWAEYFLKSVDYTHWIYVMSKILSMMFRQQQFSSAIVSYVVCTMPMEIWTHMIKAANQITQACLLGEDADAEHHRLLFLCHPIYPTHHPEWKKQKTLLDRFCRWGL